MTRAVAATLAVAITAAAGATAWWLATPRSTTHAQATVSVATAVVARTTLTTTTQLSGTLGYAGNYALASQLTGTVTALPTPGTVLRRGQQVYEVDGVGVFLGYGARPAWRPFAIGMTPGPDVLELEQNLTALGFGSDLLVDSTFTWATEQAVRDWQFATGQPVTGTVELGRLVFAPSALRIVSANVALGAPAQPGQPILTASSPDPVVTVDVSVTQTYLVHRGDRVVVTVPSGAMSSGSVVDLSPVAASSTSGGQAGGNQQSQQNGPQQASVPALVRLDHPSVAAHLDQAPVTVTITDRRVAGVLAVPVMALVALSGGGFAVWVDSDAGRHLVAVTPGLFANSLVQVSASGLKAGDRVEVPAQ